MEDEESHLGDVTASTKCCATSNLNNEAMNSCLEKSFDSRMGRDTSQRSR